MSWVVLLPAAILLSYTPSYVGSRKSLVKVVSFEQSSMAWFFVDIVTSRVIQTQRSLSASYS